MKQIPMNIFPRTLLSSAVLLAAVTSCLLGDSTRGETSPASPPNIIVILADDMGFSDIGSYGGEVQTPNLDRLAREGFRYSNFYNAGRCCPTRASLLTGLYPHRAEMGWMTSADMRRPGYHNDLAKNAITIAEGLKPAGYRSYVAGKWHVVADAHAGPDSKDKSNWPLQRGFDRYYGSFAGGSYFSLKANKDVFVDNEIVKVGGPDYYYTDAVSDTACRFIDEHVGQQEGRPFFCYMAYTAPHFPLQAKESDILKYQGKFDEGWDVLRERRLARLKELGLVDASCPLSPRSDKPWTETTPEEKADYTRRMEVYAAMIDSMDQGIGRVIEALERLDQLDNTLILFASDNGSTEENFKNPQVEPNPAKIGSPGYSGMVRRPWANLSNAPFRLFKSYSHEGGIATPLVVRWGGKIPDPGAVRHRVGHVMDILPTCLEAAGVPYPAKRGDFDVIPVQGTSLLPSFTKDEPGHALLGFEHQGTHAIRKGEWKLVAGGVDVPWELYNLSTDRSETRDLAQEKPDIVSELSKEWTDWAQANNVLPLEDSTWEERRKPPAGL